MAEESIGAMWRRETKGGDVYFSGEVEVGGRKVSFVAFKNRYKEKDTHPDFRILPKRERDRDASVPF